jgi:hydroxyethylthiazole kinase-like uncharacterized protein yjeF
VLPRLPSRPADAHKGSCGRVLVVAGSRGMAGAAVLAANGAYRGGAGLVTLAVPDPLIDVVASLQVCAIVRSLDDLPDADVVAIGPGLGRASETVNRVHSLVSSSKKPLVIDADGLNAFSADPDRLASGASPRILTPHPGELERLVGPGPDDRRKAAESAARRFKSVIVLKGRGTVISDGKRTEVNASGNPGMATGGAGDVLTGLIAALVAQGLAPFEAARLGVHLHGRAGDLAVKKLGVHSLMATDLLDYLPAAFLEHKRRSR